MSRYVKKEAFIALLNKRIYCLCGGETVKETRNIRDMLEVFPDADVKPVAEIINAVEDAILVLNAINSRGNESFDYADYWELHDAISSICPNCGAEMRKEEDDER